jgi:hypothetical protein
MTEKTTDTFSAGVPVRRAASMIVVDRQPGHAVGVVVDPSLFLEAESTDAILSNEQLLIQRWRDLVNAPETLNMLRFTKFRLVAPVSRRHLFPNSMVVSGVTLTTSQSPAGLADRVATGLGAPVGVVLLLISFLRAAVADLHGTYTARNPRRSGGHSLGRERYVRFRRSRPRCKASAQDG